MHLKVEICLKFFAVLTLLLNFNPSYADALNKQGLPLYYWRQPNMVNFGDVLSLKLVERIVGQEVEVYKKKKFTYEKKLLAIGSVLICASQNDVVWGTGTNGKRIQKNDFDFTKLDIRAVRGPLTRKLLIETLGMECPEIYGDPALLIPYFFPELKKKKYPEYDFIVIPHYTEQSLFPKNNKVEIVYPTEDVFAVIKKILNSRFVISSSLHGIIVAEAFGIPARYLRVTENEPLLKYQDYYLSTNRPDFQIARSVEEALLMGGEKPYKCDLETLYKAFPFEFWPDAIIKEIKFKKNARK